MHCKHHCSTPCCSKLLAIKLDRRYNIVCSCACTQEGERVQESDQQRREEGGGKGERSEKEKGGEEGKQSLSQHALK